MLFRCLDMYTLVCSIEYHRRTLILPFTQRFFNRLVAVSWGPPHPHSWKHHHDLLVLLEIATCHSDKSWACSITSDAFCIFPPNSTVQIWTPSLTTSRYNFSFSDFPSFSLHYGCKACTTSWVGASPPKKAIVLCDRIIPCSALTLLAALLLQQPFPDSGAASSPSAHSPVNDGGPWSSSQSFKSPKEQRGGNKAFPSSLVPWDSGFIFTITQTVTLPFIYSIVIFKLPIVSQTFILDIGERFI